MDESGQPGTGGHGADHRDRPTEPSGADTASARPPEGDGARPADPAGNGAERETPRPTPGTEHSAPRPAKRAPDGATGRGEGRDGASADGASTDSAATGVGATGAGAADVAPATGESSGADPSDDGRRNGSPSDGNASDSGSSEHDAPGEGAPDSGTPGEGAPDSGAPAHGTPDFGTPANGTTPPAKPRTRGAGRIPPSRPEPGGGILMGRPFGVPVYVAPSWFLVAVLITWVFGEQLERVLPELGGVRYLVSLFFAVAFYASVLVHELAHTVAALRFELPVRRIQLQFFGGVSEIEKETETPGREFVLAFVGPLLSLVLAGLFYLGMLAVEPGTVPGVLLAGLMISNLLVAAFNLLPGLPLDGGRMLRAVIWKLTGKPMAGTVAAAWVGRALAVSVLVGLPLFTQYGVGDDGGEFGGWDTLTDALLAAILAGIIWTGAGNSLRMARLREHLPELRARTLTRRALPVEYDTPLSESLRRANEAGARALVIVDPEGEPRALVREAAIVGVPQHRRPWVAAGSLAQEISPGMLVSAELAGEELLDVLRATPASEYLVVEESGAIYGVLSAVDVERAFVKAMARRG